MKSQNRTPRVLWMFPGQGSQRPGMLEDVQSITGQPLPELPSLDFDLKAILAGDADALKQTENAQPALLATNLAWWDALLNQTSQQCLSDQAIFAGHSLGEYAALVAAQKLNLKSALQTVRARGLAMKEAEGSMLAVIKFADIANWVKSMQAEGHAIEVANYNSPEQTVLAGTSQSIQHAHEELINLHVRAIPLRVSAPFHSSLMLPAKEKFAATLEHVRIEPSTFAVIANVDAKMYSEDYSKDLLLEQIDHSVQWVQTIQRAYDLGVRHFIEVGPGNVLSGLVARILPPDDDVWIACCEKHYAEIVERLDL